MSGCLFGEMPDFCRKEEEGWKKKSGWRVEGKRLCTRFDGPLGGSVGVHFFAHAGLNAASF